MVPVEPAILAIAYGTMRCVFRLLESALSLASAMPVVRSRANAGGRRAHVPGARMGGARGMGVVAASLFLGLMGLAGCATEPTAPEGDASIALLRPDQVDPSLRARHQGKPEVGEFVGRDQPALGLSEAVDWSLDRLIEAAAGSIAPGAPAPRGIAVAPVMLLPSTVQTEATRDATQRLAEGIVRRYPGLPLRRFEAPVGRDADWLVAMRFITTAPAPVGMASQAAAPGPAASTTIQGLAGEPVVLLCAALIDLKTGLPRARVARAVERGSVDLVPLAYDRDAIAVLRWPYPLVDVTGCLGGQMAEPGGVADSRGVADAGSSAASKVGGIDLTAELAQALHAIDSRDFKLADRRIRALAQRPGVTGLVAEQLKIHLAALTYRMATVTPSIEHIVTRRLADGGIELRLGFASGASSLPTAAPARALRARWLRAIGNGLVRQGGCAGVLALRDTLDRQASTDAGMAIADERANAVVADLLRLVPALGTSRGVSTRPRLSVLTEPIDALAPLAGLQIGMPTGDLRDDRDRRVLIAQQPCLSATP